MARTIRKKKARKKRRSRYSTGEWFMVILGAAILVMIAGIVITALLGG
jgi:succinate dehydrogenase hydrophobic anchor subunit